MILHDSDTFQSDKNMKIFKSVGVGGLYHSGELPFHYSHEECLLMKKGFATRSAGQLRSILRKGIK